MFRGDEEAPSYMLAADTHQVANGQPSVLEPAAYVDTGIDFGKFAITATARAVTSAFNTVPAVANWFGADISELQTDQILESFDSNLSAYYNENRATVDVVGDVVAMFVPGMAGVKGLNYAQKGLAAVAKGENIGSRIAHSFGTLPHLGNKYAAEAAAKMANSGNTFRLLEGNTIKAFAANYGQAAIEAAAFEVAAASVMDNSPLFENHSVKDVLYNAALGGGVVGAGLIGTITAAQTYGQLKRASDLFGKALAPFRRTEGIEEGVDPYVRLLELRNQRSQVPELGEGIPSTLPEDQIKGLMAQQQRALEKRQRDINNEMQTILTRISGGDAEAALALGKSLDQVFPESSFATLFGLKEASRLGSVTKLEMEAIAAAKAGKETDIAVKYVDLATGAVAHTPPGAMSLVDMVGNTKELLKDVERRVSTQPVVGKDYSVVGQNHLDVEARYIEAFRNAGEIDPRVAIGPRDLPYLDAAVSSGRGANVNGMWYDAASLREYVKEVKRREADNLADYLALDPTMNSAIAAKLLNVDKRALEGSGYKGDLDTHFWAKTEFSTEPQHLKVVYQAPSVDGNVLSGMVGIKQLQQVQAQTNKQAVAHTLGEDAEKLFAVDITTEKILGASTAGGGAHAVAAASGEYGTLASTVEYIGKVVSELKQKAHTLISDTLTPSMYAALQKPEAINEIAVVRQAVLQTGEKYVLREVGGEFKVVLKQVDEYDTAILAGKQNVPEPVIPKGVPPELVIKTEEAKKFLTDLTEWNTTHLQKERTLRNATGRGMGNWDNVVYFPQPSSKEFPYFSFVRPKNPWEGEHTQMIWARSAEELAELEAKVPHEYTVLRKSDTDAYYKALKEYDADLGMNSREIMSELQRKGVAAPFIPETNGQTLFEDILSHYKRVSDKQIRDAVSLNYNVQFEELRRMDSQYKGVRGSKKPGAGEDVGVTPYESYIKTALDIPRSSYLPVWTELNNLAESTVTKVWNSVKATWGKKKTEDEIAAINQEFDKAGFRGVKDSLTEMVANHPADKRVLSQWVQSANALFSTLVLRTDPMNALNNGIGNLVLTGSETSYLTRLIAGKGGQEGAAFLRELGEVRLPGSEAYVRSPAKLISRAYSDFFSYLRNEPEAVARFGKYEKAGWMPSMMDQLRQSFDAMTLTGIESSSQISAKISAASKATGDFLEKASLNKFAETMNRFVAAHIADDISAAGVKYAGLSEGDALTFINTFVNRTQGNYIASQRPLMFQGPIGQAISLFMTYQFNMLQHIFRHLSSDGNRKQAAILMGLQTSIYGMNGLPAFNFMNQHLVGGASGNREHSDVYSVAADVPGVGNWLLYGSLSNATGLGLYSRGDLNPRHLTVVPNSIADIPFISGATKFFGALSGAVGEIGAGANPASAFLRGIEHAGISRPLAGLAQVINGGMRDDNMVYSTTTKGNVVYAQDLYSLATLGRVAGARPLDEAVTRDAYYRVQVYESNDRAKVNKIGAAIRDKVNAGVEITDEDYYSFMSRYVSAGGDQKNFVKFYQQRVKEAGKNQIASLVEKGNSPSSRYMQNLMRSLDSDPVSLEN